MTSVAGAPPARILLLPGWMNSSPAHWQSRWQVLYQYQRVDQDDWLWPKRGDWMARLDETLLGDIATPAVLVAHSLGCQLVASWAAHSKHTHLVKAALLVAPPDPEREDMPAQLYNWRPIARQRLSFASLVVTSADDPYASPDRAASMAADWGSESFLLGACGHINGDSGLGDWPEGHALLQALLGKAA